MNDKKNNNCPEENEEMYEYMDAYLEYCEKYSTWLKLLPEDFDDSDVLDEMLRKASSTPVMPGGGLCLGLNVPEDYETDDIFGLLLDKERLFPKSLFPMYYSSDGSEIIATGIPESRFYEIVDEANALYPELLQAKSATQSLEDYYRVIVKGEDKI